jgi:hypothetical protein
MASSTAGVQNGLPSISLPRNDVRVAQTPQGRFPLEDHRRHALRLILDSAWAERGWTLQEAALSKCLLIFASAFTLLLCDQETVYDRYGDQDPPDTDHKA